MNTHIFFAKLLVTFSVAILFGILSFTDTALTQQQLFLKYWHIYLLGSALVILLWYGDRIRK
jgi:hypothetical protein